MAAILLNTLRSSVVPPLFVVILACVTWSCGIHRNSPSNHEFISPDLNVWYRQAIVDLGHRIQMYSPYDGVAISRVRGRYVKGKAYRFTNGQWSSFFSYDYSDYPLIDKTVSDKIWTVTHRTHEGAYQPVFSEFRNDVRSELSLPQIMWDDVDYVMYKGIHRFPNRTAWMVGQQGHILYFDGTRWNEKDSPLINPARSTVYEGDLNDITMTSFTFSEGQRIYIAGGLFNCWRKSSSACQ